MANENTLTDALAHYLLPTTPAVDAVYADNYFQVTNTKYLFDGAVNQAICILQSVIAPQMANDAPAWIDAYLKILWAGRADANAHLEVERVIQMAKILQIGCYYGGEIKVAPRAYASAHPNPHLVVSYAKGDNTKLLMAYDLLRIPSDFLPWMPCAKHFLQAVRGSKIIEYTR